MDSLNNCTDKREEVNQHIINNNQMVGDIIGLLNSADEMERQRVEIAIADYAGIETRDVRGWLLSKLIPV